MQQHGFFYGYNSAVWGSILLQAVGGLLVAVVVKYADNILKGFAASFAVVLTFLISMVFSHFDPNHNFYIGAVRRICCINDDMHKNAENFIYTLAI